jgi:hypothetical protein
MAHTRYNTLTDYELLTLVRSTAMDDLTAELAARLEALMPDQPPPRATRYVSDLSVESRRFRLIRRGDDT